jgi:hypothetical protein
VALFRFDAAEQVDVGNGRVDQFVPFRSIAPKTFA